MGPPQGDKFQTGEWAVIVGMTLGLWLRFTVREDRAKDFSEWLFCSLAWDIIRFSWIVLSGELSSRPSGDTLFVVILSLISCSSSGLSGVQGQGPQRRLAPWVSLIAAFLLHQLTLSLTLCSLRTYSTLFLLFKWLQSALKLCLKWLPTLCY